MFLKQRRLALGPYILCNLLLTGIIVGIAFHDILFRSYRAGDSHLSQELYGTVQAEGAVALVGIQVQLSGNLTFAQLPVDKGRAVRRVFVHTAVMQTHGASLLVELEAGAQFNVRTITLLCGRCAQFPVGSHIGRRIGNGPVDVAGNGIQFVNRLVGGSLGTGGKQDSQVGAG